MCYKFTWDFYNHLSYTFPFGFMSSITEDHSHALSGLHYLIYHTSGLHVIFYIWQ